MSETQSFQFGGVSTLPPVNPPFVGINGEVIKCAQKCGVCGCYFFFSKRITIKVFENDF